MVATIPIMGYKTKVQFKDTAEGNVAVTQPFLAEGLTHVEAVLENQGMRGTLTHEEKLDVGGATRNGGALSFVPNRTLLENWLKQILGASVIMAGTEAGDGSNQLSGETNITGIRKGVNTSSAGLLYISVIDDTGGFFHIGIFKDSGRTQLVAHTATYNSTGAKALVADNTSGIGGTITVDAVGPADADITYTITSVKYYLTSELLQTLTVEVWRGAGGGTFSGGAVNRATVSGKSGGMLEIALDLLFKTWADLAAATAENLPAGRPYQFSGVVFNFNSAAYRVKSFDLVIDWQAADDHRNNSQDLQEIVAKGREIKLSAILTYSETNEALTALVLAKTSGDFNSYAASLVCTHGDGHTVTVTMPKTRINTGAPVAGSKAGEIDLPIEISVLGTTTRDDEISVTVADA